jgi:hypothetical protein
MIHHKSDCNFKKYINFERLKEDKNMHVASLMMEIMIKRQIWMSNAIYHLLILLLFPKVDITFKIII